MKTGTGKLPYAAIIGDIKHSREVQNRQEAQEKFIHVLEQLNKKYETDLASKFVVALGDSFQGLLQKKGKTLSILFEIEMMMAPLEMRFGIGLGDISTSIRKDNSLEMDGSAYHRARKMVEAVEEGETQYAKSETNIMICSGEEHEDTDKLMNAVFSLSTALKSKWSDRQKEIIYAYYTNGENQYKAAESLGITQSSVNKSLNGAKFYTYKAAFMDINHLLSSMEGTEG